MKTSPPRPGLGKSVLSVLDQAAVSGTNFATSVLIGRVCSQEDLGVYALALSVVLFLRGIQGELICSPYTVYCGRRQGDDLRAYTGSSLAHFLGLTALSTLGLSLAAAGLTLAGGLTPAARTAWVLAGALPFLLVREYARQTALAHLRLRALLAIDGSVAVIQVGGLGLLALCGALSVGAAYAVMGAACAVASLGWFLGGRLPLRVVRARLLADWRHNWGFARWSLSSFLIGSTTLYVLPWAVAAAHGESATGLLAACFTIVNCAGMYVTGVSNFLTPRAARAFAEGGLGDLRRVLRQTALLFLVTLGAFCLAVLATGDLAATLIYGGKYAGTGPVLALLAVNLLVNSLGVTAGNGLWALDRPRANFLADLCTFGVSLTLLFTLVGPLGVLGAALALLAGTCAGVTVRVLRLRALLAEVGRGPAIVEGGAA
jgi:O-antigen/teichoic acid export membrane protein